MKKIYLTLSLLYAISTGARADQVDLINDRTTQGVLNGDHLKTFISFTAERIQGTCYLRWLTGNVQGAAHFDVQRSYDAITFTTIGSTGAKDNGSSEYLFTDRSPLTGFAWYRLRSVDAGGKTVYSKVEMVAETVIATNSFVIISPVRHAITILNKTGHEGRFDYSLTNTATQVIIKGTASMKAEGSATLSLPKSIAGGMHVLHISNDSIKFRRRVLIEK